MFWSFLSSIGVTTSTKVTADSPLCDLYLASVSPAETVVRAAAAVALLLAGGPRGAAKQATPKGGGCELEKSTGSVCSRPVCCWLVASWLVS